MELIVKKQRCWWTSMFTASVCGSKVSWLRSNTHQGSPLLSEQRDSQFFPNTTSILSPWRHTKSVRLSCRPWPVPNRRTCWEKKTKKRVHHNGVPVQVQVAVMLKTETQSYLHGMADEAESGRVSRTGVIHPLVFTGPVLRPTAEKWVGTVGEPPSDIYDYEQWGCYRNIWVSVWGAGLTRGRPRHHTRRRGWRSSQAEGRTAQWPARFHKTNPHWCCWGPQTTWRRSLQEAAPARRRSAACRGTSHAASAEKTVVWVPDSRLSSVIPEVSVFCVFMFLCYREKMENWKTSEGILKGSNETDVKNCVAAS